MAKGPHSAIPSWSGYVYQGKVAIYHILRIIEEALSANISKEFYNYDLEVEWQEDFSILIDGKYESIHQVKAYESTSSPTVYNDALDGLFDKLSKGIGKTGYLNIWNSIGYTKNTESKNFTELKISRQGKYSQDVLDNVKIYEYCNGKDHADLDEIDNLILKKIEQIYGHNNFGITSITPKQYELVKSKIFFILDTHILEVHRDSMKKKDAIPFNRIIDILKQNYEDYSLEYKYIKVKDNLFKMIDKYCKNSENCSIDINNINCSFCSLYKIEGELEKQTSKEVYDLIMQYTPYYERFEDLFNEAGLIFGLSKIFHSLNIKHKTREGHYKNNFLYLPTTIHEQRNLANIAIQTLKNTNLDSIVNQYEIDIFISDDVKSDDLLKASRNSKDIKSKDIDELFGVERRGAIDKIKKIQIKPLNDVKEELQ